mmetsp:Transcript_97301/g.253562  ORF Transcript_97301/g.253562 Transcript_97301/m.253562 type:complete len:80 (+) Transcript_97301:51-290(+)
MARGSGEEAAAEAASAARVGPSSGCRVPGANPPLTEQDMDIIKQDDWLTTAPEAKEKGSLSSCPMGLLVCSCFDRRSLR